MLLDSKIINIAYKVACLGDQTFETRLEAAYVVTNLINYGPDIVPDRVATEFQDVVGCLITLMKVFFMKQELILDIVSSLYRLSEHSDREVFLTQFQQANGFETLYEA